jgi:hypothetical protein
MPSLTELCDHSEAERLARLRCLRQAEIDPSIFAMTLPAGAR